MYLGMFRSHRWISYFSALSQHRVFSDRGINFEGTNFEGTNFEETNFEETNFKETNFGETNFKKAEKWGTKF